MSKRMFVGFGQTAHRFEIKMNRYIAAEEPAHKQTKSAKLTEVDDQESLLYIKPLSDDAAFNKGVEWAADVFFFYAVFLIYAIYEVHKAHHKDEAQKKLQNDTKYELETQHLLAGNLEKELKDAALSRAYNS